jgi:hypothetical protein
MGAIIGLYLHHLYDSLSITAGNGEMPTELVPLDQCPSQQLIIAGIKEVMFLTTEASPTYGGMEQKAPKLALLYILNDTITNNKVSDVAENWVFENLVPLCYSWTVRALFFPALDQRRQGRQLHRPGSGHGTHR